LGYGGAALCFFLSVAGAYVAGSATIKQLENSFFSFLEDFQDNDNYVALMDDADMGQAFYDFLVYYSWDMLVMGLAMYWHCSFLIGMGLLAAVLIISKVKAYATTNGDADSIPIDKSWTLLLFGALWGVVDYLAGQAVSVNKVTILELLGFNAQVITKTTTITNSITDPFYATTTSTFTSAREYERKRDLFALNEIMEEWNMLFWTQRAL